MMKTIMLLSFSYTLNILFTNALPLYPGPIIPRSNAFPLHPGRLPSHYIHVHCPPITSRSTALPLHPGPLPGNISLRPIIIIPC